MSSLYRNGLDAAPACRHGDRCGVPQPQAAAQASDMAPGPSFRVENGGDGAAPGGLPTVQYDRDGGFKLKQSEVDLLACSRDRARCSLRLQLRADFNHGRVQRRSSASGSTVLSSRRFAAAARSFARGQPKLTLACRRLPTKHEYGHWHAVVVDERDRSMVATSALSAAPGYPADDEADHYGVVGCSSVRAAAQVSPRKSGLRRNREGEICPVRGFLGERDRVLCKVIAW